MRVCVAALLAVSLAFGCKGAQKTKSKAAPTTSASPSAFPGAAPESAKELAGGGRWLLVRQGKPPGPQAPRQLVAAVKVWDPSGKPIFNSAANPNGIVIGLETLQPSLQEMIRVTGMNGVARAWLPPDAMQGWKPHSFPTGELVYELTILGDLPPPVMEVEEVAGTAAPLVASALAAAAAAPPDLSGPPSDARSTGSGLKFVVLTTGDSARPAPGSKVQLSADAWVTKGLSVEQAVKQHPVALKAQAAPGGLWDVLQQLGRSGRARVWIPGPKAVVIFPQLKDQPFVLDLTLQTIDGT